MSSKKKKFESPFIYSTFSSTDNKSVQSVYQDRILDIYKTKYDALKDTTIEKIYDKIYKLKKLEIEKEKEKKKKEEELKKKEKEEKEKKEKEAEENKDENKNENDNDNDNDKDENKEKDKDKEKEKEKDDKNGDKKDEDKNEKKDEEKTEELTVCDEEKKLMKALELLENEYIGREHEFYIFLCNKYEINKIKDEYIISQYFPPFLNDYLSETNNGSLICFECNNMKLRAEFDADELNNGPYLACRQCAPDRDSVKTLKWHAMYRSQGNLKLEQQNHIARVSGNGHQYALIDSNPVKSGIHCWRWKSNKHRTWLLWGISYLQEYNAPTYLKDGVYGISGSNQSYKSGQQNRDIPTTHFYENQNEAFIDMKLDFVRGELSFLVVGADKTKIATITGLPKNTKKGFVPHIDIYYRDSQCQIKKIPASWFGRNAGRVKFQW